MRYLVSAVLIGLLLCAVAPITNAEQFGPFDYYSPPKGTLSVVERVHFAAQTTQYAAKGNWCAYWDDLDYTLRAFPNHPRALVAMATYLDSHPACFDEKLKTKQSASDTLNEIESGAWRERNADYYFTEGIAFRPKRAETRMLYADYLKKHSRREDALRQYKEAETANPNSAPLHYELGQLYLDTGQSQLALKHARRAYQLGATQPDLKRKLIEAKLWTD